MPKDQSPSIQTANFEDTTLIVSATTLDNIPKTYVISSDLPEEAVCFVQVNIQDSFVIKGVDSLCIGNGNIYGKFKYILSDKKISQSEFDAVHWLKTFSQNLPIVTFGGLSSFVVSPFLKHVRDSSDSAYIIDMQRILYRLSNGLVGGNPVISAHDLIRPLSLNICNIPLNDSILTRKPKTSCEDQPAQCDLRSNHQLMTNIVLWNHLQQVAKKALNKDRITPFDMYQLSMTHDVTKSTSKFTSTAAKPRFYSTSSPHFYTLPKNVVTTAIATTLLKASRLIR